MWLPKIEEKVGGFTHMVSPTVLKNCRVYFGTATSSHSTAITILNNVASHTLSKWDSCSTCANR